MTREDKIKELEYNTKLLALRLKYEKRPVKILLLSMAVRMGLFQIAIIQSQPIPKHPKGGVIAGENKYPEQIILRDGKRINLNQ